MNFVKASLKYKQVTITTLIIVFVIGVYSLLNMPRREDAKINVRQGQIIALYPGANSLQVEKQLTEKLEQYLFQFSEVRKERTFSTTRDGIVIINIWLNGNVKDSDIFWNKLRHQLLTAKVIDLPKGVIGPLVNSDFGDTEAIVIGVNADGVDYTQLNEYSKKIEDGLRTIPAVSKVKRLGAQKDEVLINVDNSKLSSYGIDLSQILSVLQSQNSIVANSNIESSNSKVSVYARGYYQNENEITDQIIGVSRTGETVKLRDVADIKRQSQEPTSKIYVNGKKSMLIALQMHEGNNIVKFGETVEKKLKEISPTLPSNVKLTTVINQPYIVEENISHFLIEFLIAIVAVILIIILLLPFRVASVAAMAIPMTIATTIAIIHSLGIELHQVSLAALIVVLGMVVDDAVVVADNYVELLDKGEDRWNAAWKSATELVVPILTATITIIAAFIPMLILSGTVGEFIEALPITVSIALASSFLVSMVFTPILCYAFIKKGLHNKGNETDSKKKFSILDVIQNGYNKLLSTCMAHPKLTVSGSIITIVIAVGLYYKVPQKFFPTAERNQFVVDLWMPTGTKLEKTEETILKIQKLIENDSRITSYTTFVGMSAPRFYYNFSPEAPVSNFAQILVNTKGVKDANNLYNELSVKVAREVPEGNPQVKLMQQGPPTIFPVEVRITGDDLSEIVSIGNNVEGILKKTGMTNTIRSDFMEDNYGIDVVINSDAQRLGISNEVVGKILYASLSGVTISTMYEGNNAIDIVLRSSSEVNKNYDVLKNTYITSPVTGASIPLHQIANLVPKWHYGRIIHRNGNRTLSIQAEPKNGVLASEILAEIKNDINDLHLPAGYTISYGGELENQTETFGEMVVALGISVMLIFLILLFQFRNLKETLIVISSIPLSMFGALLGLLITNNDFGFTAFMGVISLSGVVVRNAIIMVDYTKELIGKGMEIKTAAFEAGKRRLRPIFLTASAAAIGVIPMIISGSPLWSPLASVIAFGIMLSMVVSLLTVPVLYQMVMKSSDKIETPKGKESTPPNNIIGNTVLIIIVTGVTIFSQTVKAQTNNQKLNLDKVTQLAVENNHLLKIKKYQVDEKDLKVKEDIVKFFPNVSVESSYKYINKLPQLTIDQGSFGVLPLQGMLVPLPSSNLVFELGKHDMTNAGVTVYQPVSQLFKIWVGTRVSQMEKMIAQTEYEKSRSQIKQAAEKLYYGLLIIQKKKLEALIKVESAREKLNEVESALESGKTIESSIMGLNANLADEEQNLLKLNIEHDDYVADMNQLTGLNLDNTVELEIPVELTIRQDSLLLDDSNAAFDENLEVKSATFLEEKAYYGKLAAKYNFLPEIGIVGGYQYQKGNSLYPKDMLFVGALFKWNIQDIFSNKFVLDQRDYIHQQTKENLLNSITQFNNDISKTYRILTQSRQLVTVAQKAVKYRKEASNIVNNRYNSGLCIKSDFLDTQASLAKAEADLFAAIVNYRLKLTDLLILTGKY